MLAKPLMHRGMTSILQIPRVSVLLRFLVRLVYYEQTINTFVQPIKNNIQ